MSGERSRRPDAGGDGGRTHGPGPVAPPRMSGPVEGDEQLLAELDQTHSETDQSLADADQSASARDQTSAEQDQLAADRDQDASDRDLASGGRLDAHAFSRELRRRSAREREQSARERLRAARQRDKVAALRDAAALARDEAAEARDLALAQLDAATAQHDAIRTLDGAELIARAAEQRQHAAELRARAAEQRMRAAEDRRAAARDREAAARERKAAQVDRQALAEELERAAIDELTGASTRAAGLKQLDHELERARRTNAQLVVAYVDVVGLKATNDSRGHAAGDLLLKDVVTHIRSQLRPYDLIIRVGGDEFLCALSNATPADAEARFRSIAALVSAAGQGGIRTGFASLRPGETAAALIARADEEMMRSAVKAPDGRSPRAA
jgi:diguanylate cyclase (GGDEF)-like protein